MKQYLENIALANKWALAYYLDENPIASDDEYDELLRKIKAFEKEFPEQISPDSPTQRVLPVSMQNVQDGFKKVEHLVKMYSMEDIFSKADLDAWLKKNDAFSEEFFIEPKFDGASLNLLYKDGFLSLAATRGDGLIGDDITQNVMQIASIPKRVAYQKTIEIRGEIVIFKDDFEALNEQRLKDGLSTFSNPRNAASGSLRLKDASEVAKRNLQFFAYGVGANELEYKKHSEVMEFIKSLGFLRDEFCHTVKAAQLQGEYERLSALRDSKKMMLDGFVLRINDLAKCVEFTSKFPKFMAAYKFAAYEKITKLLDVSFSVGRTGAITPVGSIEPVNIDGAIVKSVTLHNFDEIKRLDLRLGDSVSIIRSGDVIPKLTKVYKERRNGLEKEIKLPTICPSCQSPLVNDGAITRCENAACSTKMLNKIIYFASKKCLNIDGLGEKIIELLFNIGKITKIQDIFALKKEDFSNLAGFADKKIANILGSIEVAKSCKLGAFINALGCENIGEVAAAKVAAEFGFDWYKKSENDFLMLDGFGEAMAKSLSEFAKNNAEMIEHFYSILRLENPAVSSSEKLQNCTFVITGTLRNSREFYENLIKENGGKTSSSVSKKTSYLLCGENAGSKLKKAQDLGVKIINEDEFMGLL